MENSGSRPNVLLITTDQQRTDSLGCYGANWTRTPHLDRLARQGLRCERAYCTNPVCTPSRVSIFTGQIVSRHGAWNVGVNTPEETVMISHRLAATDYRTHYVGKIHFQAYDDPQSREKAGEWEKRSAAFNKPYFGFETVEICMGHSTYGIDGHYGAWVKSQLSPEEFERVHQRSTPRSEFVFQGVARDWDLPTRLHNSVWTADRTVEFLRRHDRSRPFFLAVGFQDPHHPHALPLDFTDRVDERAVPLPDYDEGELDDKPPFFMEAHCGTLEQSSERGKFFVAGQGKGHDYRHVTPEAARLSRAYYYGMVRLIDQQMGRILSCLEESGLADNTLVIFTSDHGELLGDHGIWLKGPFHYEPLIRVPLMLRWPGGFSAAPATGSLVSLVDLAPTVLEAAGLEIPAELDGKSLLPLLRGQVPAVRDHALVECVDDPERLRLKTIVTPTRKLTWYAGRDFGELYDLELDPGEKINRWNAPSYAADKSGLLGKLLGELERQERRGPRRAYA